MASTLTVILTSISLISRCLAILPVNIPLHGKPTNQTGTVGGLTSDKAVDGRTFSGADGNRYCAQLENSPGQPAEWWIDLGMMYRIYTVTLHNTGQRNDYLLMQNFTIRLHSPYVRSAVTCAIYREHVEPASSVKLTCRYRTFGRYVQFVRLGGQNIHKATICEVQITGIPYSDCPLNYYGSTCNRVCGRCAAVDPYIGNPCDKTGSCLNGCMMWYAADKCQAEIVRPNRTDQTFRLLGATSNTVRIQLEQISVPSEMTKFYGYSIRYAEYDVHIRHVQSKTHVSFILTSLYYNTEYTVAVRPYRVMRGIYDYGVGYPVKTFKTECAGPDDPEIRSIVSKPSSERRHFDIDITYRLPSEIRCDSLARLLVFYRAHRTPEWSHINASLTGNTVSIRSVPRNVYVIKMVLTNNAGLQSESLTQRVRAKDDPEWLAYLIPLLFLILVFMVVMAVKSFQRKRREKDTDYYSLWEDDDDIVWLPTKTTADFIFRSRSLPELSRSTEFWQPRSDGTDHKRRELVSTEYSNLAKQDVNFPVKKESEIDSTNNLTAHHLSYASADLIQGCSNVLSYIAAGSPHTDTVQEFWRMIWQCNVNRIVLFATVLDEDTKSYHQYWPKTAGHCEQYGDFNVTLKSDSVVADYHVRTLELKNESDRRTVRQFHFTTWADGSRPMYGALTLLAFRRKVHSMDKQSTGPLVVHAGIGAGRTGAFIALDMILRQMSCEGFVDIYGCIQKLEVQKLLIAQAKAHYVVLHEAVLEVMNVGTTVYPCTEMAKQINNIFKEDDSGGSRLHREFELLCKLKHKPVDQNKDGLLEDNINKNRDPAVIPADTDRPFLYTPSFDGNNYINAVYVDSFKKHDHYIVTQMPLPNTKVDFWRLVYDHEIKFVVMLNEVDPSNEACQQYWPEEGSETYGPITVRHLSTTNLSKTIISLNAVVRKFELSLVQNEGDGEESGLRRHQVRHYQLLGWPNSERLPPDVNSFLGLVEMASRWHRQQTSPSSQGIDRTNSVLVHCLNGVTRVGLFCGVSHVLNQIKANNEVDALSAARQVSRTRQQFFKTEEEYKFLYEIAVHSVSRCRSDDESVDLNSVKS